MLPDHEEVFEFFQIKTFDDVIIVRPKSSELVDMSTFSLLKRLLARLVLPQSPKKVFLDFVDVDFLSSSVVNTLFRIKRLTELKGSQLALCNLKPGIREIFLMTRLDTIFAVRPYPNEDDPEEGSGATSHLNPNPPASAGGIALPLPSPEADDE
jgi:anti-sigma B factor antagonist